MTTLPDASPCQFPLGWNGDELGWVATGAWLGASFPSFERRRGALIERMRACFGEPHPLCDASVALLEEVWSAPAPTTTDAIVALHDRMHTMPSCASWSVSALHLVIAALASLQRPDGEPPIATAVHCCGWTTIPSELAELAVDVAVALPRWYDAQMLGLVRIPVVPTNGLDDGDLSDFDRDVEVYLERHGEGFRREAGHDDEPNGNTLQRRMLRHLARVAAALADATGSTAPMWSPTATLADWLARRGAAGFSALGTVTRRPDYFLRVMPLVDHRDPRTLPLYEAYADGCDPAHWEHVELAAGALARDISPRAVATTLLRAATRRFFTSDFAGCRDIAQQAFTASQHADDRDGAWFAAGLIARTSAMDDPLAARAWLTTAQALTPAQNAVARLGVAVELAAACEATGDEIGRRRASAEVDRIRTSMEPERVSDLLDECSRPIESNVARSYGDFDRVAELLARDEFEEAYSAFSEQLGELVETMTASDAVERLRVALPIVESIGPAGPHGAAWEIWGAPTLGSWLCGAIADLLVEPARDDEWEDARRRQFTLEDHPGAIPEELFSGEGAHLLQLMETLDATEASEAAFLSALTTARLRRALAAAEFALAEGRPRRARFWTERAAELRRRP